MQAVRAAWKKDVDAAKEVNQLRKQDQLDNYQRGKQTHSLYK